MGRRKGASLRRLNSAALSTRRAFDVGTGLLSFIRIAEELHITHCAVSQHIEALEERLGCKLPFRLPGRIQLTDDGRRFAEVVTRALPEFEAAAETQMRADRSRVNVRLRASSSVALRWLTARPRRLRVRHPPGVVGVPFSARRFAFPLSVYFFERRRAASVSSAIVQRCALGCGAEHWRIPGIVEQLRCARLHAPPFACPDTGTSQAYTQPTCSAATRSRNVHDR